MSILQRAAETESPAPTAGAWCVAVAEAVTQGRISVRTARQCVDDLDRLGHRQLAENLGRVVQQRAQVLRRGAR